ncbi:response regulator [Deltaproteobacteria bacterium]|nr:response regulator [Deltaproteobacteria bacterium]
MTRLKRIMVVDDEAGIRNLLSDALAAEGFKVTLAKNGQDSLKQMRNRRFDLLITDINMPCLDGVGLLRKMKKEGRKERVIIMSGGAFDDSRLRKEIPQVFIQLKKPFCMNHLLKVVSSALGPDSKKKRVNRNRGKG